MEPEIKPGTDQATQSPANKEVAISKEIFADLNKKIAALEKDLSAEKQAHLSTMQINEALQEKIEDKETATKKQGKASKATKVPEKSFKVNKIDYVFTVASFMHPDVFSDAKLPEDRKLLSSAGRKTAEEALGDPNLLEFLVKEKSGVIKRKGEK